MPKKFRASLNALMAKYEALGEDAEPEEFDQVWAAQVRWTRKVQARLRKEKKAQIPKSGLEVRVTGSWVSRSANVSQAQSLIIQTLAKINGNLKQMVDMKRYKVCIPTSFRSTNVLTPYRLVCLGWRTRIQMNLTMRMWRQVVLVHHSRDSLVSRWCSVGRSWLGLCLLGFG